jgi:hypothetical protein
MNERENDRCQVSVRGTTHERIKLEAERRGIKISQLVETAVTSALDLAEAQDVDSTSGEG